MVTSLLIARLLIAGVLGIAALTKAVDLAGSRQAMIDFGVPERLAAAAGVGLPVVEGVLAVLLLPRATAPVAAALSGALMLAFAAGIMAALVKGRHPDCHCFGQLHSEPAGRSTVIRDLFLAGVAGFVAVAGWNDPGTSVTGWIGSLSTAQAIGAGAAVVFAGLFAFQVWFSLQLLRQNGRVLTRLEALEAAVQGRAATELLGSRDHSTTRVAGLPIGAPAPPFALPALDGEIVTLDGLRSSGRPVLLVFSDPSCGSCNALLADVARWQRVQSKRLTIALISRGTAEQNAAKAGGHEPSDVLLQRDREAAESYRAHGTPSAVLVSVDGRIASPLALGPQAIGALVENATSANPVLQVMASSSNGGNGSFDTSKAAPTASPQPAVRQNSTIPEPVAAGPAPDRADLASQERELP
ncbi:MAG: MauE/DoxX family redox-associated membrane protein [Solirubrobacteraceae bacterium]